MIPAPRRLAALSPLVVLAAGCATTNERFDVRYTTEFTAGPKTVSAVGVFHDGLLSEEAWALFGPRFSPVFRQDLCETWYGQKLAAVTPELFASLGKAARDEGISDDLLGGIAPHAEGSHLVVFEVYGRPPQQTHRSTGDAGILVAHGGGAADSHFLPKRFPTEAAAMEVSATLFSVATRHSVARVVMEYTGSRIDEAATKFSQKLAIAIPDATCVGWRWPANTED